ncbi:MAG: butyryl-CoA dehydrogenase, partial [Rhodococcus erythropolis]
MGHYKSNVRDIEFNLFEVLGIGELLDAGAYGDLDTDTVRNILAEVARLAEGPVAASFADADRNPVEFDAPNHAVVVPEPLRKTVEAV